MPKPTTPIDDLIESKLEALSAIRQEVRAAEAEHRRLERAAMPLEREMQQLLIARSVLRDGKAYGQGDAHVELGQLITAHNTRCDPPLGHGDEGTGSGEARA